MQIALSQISPTNIKLRYDLPAEDYQIDLKSIIYFATGDATGYPGEKDIVYIGLSLNLLVLCQNWNMII